jgi:type I restriction enzyme S subunit
LGLGEIKNFEIPLPPLPIQHKIVSILEKAESLKQKRELANEEANKIIQSIFYDMFGNKGFEKRKLKEFTSLISSGSTPLGGSKNYLTQGEFLFIRSQNVLMNKFSQHEKLFISSDIHNNMKRTWVKKNDVLLNITGASIGRTAIYNGEDNKANVNQHVCIIRLNQTSKISNVYLNFFLSSQEMQDYILKRNAGATRQALNFTQIGNFEIPLPPISLQKQFASIVEKIESIKHKQNLATEEISTLFDALMQKAFNGELTE